YNSALIVLYEFSSLPCSFEYFTSLNFEYSTSLFYTSDLIFAIPLESSLYNLEYIASSPNLEYVNLSPNLKYIDSSTNLEYSISSIYTSNYSTLSYISEEINLLLNDSNNFIAINDTFDYPDSLNIPTLQNSKKHKSVFVTSLNKKPKPGKSWVWCHMKKDKYVKKETKY
ncbi:15954_t:CDS:1, partial [Gigaspora rosea]